MMRPACIGPLSCRTSYDLLKIAASCSRHRWMKWYWGRQDRSTGMQLAPMNACLLLYGCERHEHRTRPTLWTGHGHLVEASTRCSWNRVTAPGLHTENIDPGPDPTRSKLLTRWPGDPWPGSISVLKCLGLEVLDLGFGLGSCHWICVMPNEICSCSLRKWCIVGATTDALRLVPPQIFPSCPKYTRHFFQLYADLS